MFQSGNDFILDLVSNESASLADDMNDDIWHTALGYPFKPNVNWKFNEDGYLILDYLLTYILTCMLYQN
jgi:hypothetical protein